LPSLLLPSAACIPSHFLRHREKKRLHFRRRRGHIPSVSPIPDRMRPLALCFCRPPLNSFLCRSLPAIAIHTKKTDSVRITLMRIPEIPSAFVRKKIENMTQNHIPAVPCISSFLSAFRSSIYPNLTPWLAVSQHSCDQFRQFFCLFSSDFCLILPKTRFILPLIRLPSFVSFRCQNFQSNQKLYQTPHHERFLLPHGRRSVSDRSPHAVISPGYRETKKLPAGTYV
jgi:hypothetical protein